MHTPTTAVLAPSHDPLRHCLAALLAATATLALPAGAQQAPAAAQAPAAQAPAAAAAAPAADLNPKAIEALQAMGKHLRSLKAFTIKADTTIDEVLTSGQKVQFAGTLDYRVQMPNRLRADVRNELKHREFYYDGKTLTQYAPRPKYYASIAAPGTIADVLQAADQKFGLQVPLSDLFFWGTDKAGIDDVKSALFVGPAKVGGLDCDHYAYRQANVDWQVWIAKGKNPLPCKLVVTTTDEPSQPQYTATLKWDVASAIPASTFAFAPPAGAKKIEIAPLSAAK